MGDTKVGLIKSSAHAKDSCERSRADPFVFWESIFHVTDFENSSCVFVQRMILENNLTVVLTMLMSFLVWTISEITRIWTVLKGSNDRKCTSKYMYIFSVLKCCYFLSY